MSLDNMYMSKLRHDQQLLNDQCDVISDAEMYRYGDITLAEFMTITPTSHQTNALLNKYVNKEGTNDGTI